MSENLIVPDAINACTINENFTIISNEMLRNPNLSLKSVGLLCFLLSNKEGWKTHLNTIEKNKPEGKKSITTGLNELEKNGYLLRFIYMDENKKTKGSFLAYTNIPFTFNLEKHYAFLKKNKMTMRPSTKASTQIWEQIKPNVQKPISQKGNSGKGNSGNAPLKILINKNNKKNKKEDTSSAATKLNGYITPSNFNKFYTLYPRKIQKGKALSSWEKLCKRKDRPKLKEIIIAIKKQKQSKQWKDPKYIPHPSTWLNQKRWFDEPNNDIPDCKESNTTISDEDFDKLDERTEVWDF